MNEDIKKRLSHRIKIIAGQVNGLEKMIDDEKDSERKRITFSYNDLGVISYIAFSSSGKYGLKET